MFLEGEQGAFLKHQAIPKPQVSVDFCVSEAEPRAQKPCGELPGSGESLSWVKRGDWRKDALQNHPLPRNPPRSPRDRQMASAGACKRYRISCGHSRIHQLWGFGLSGLGTV